MSRTRGFRAVLVTMLVAVACSEEPTTSVPVVDLQEPTDLALSFPIITQEALVQGHVRAAVPESGPAGSLGNEGSGVPDDDVVAEIFNAQTNVGFRPTYAYANGRHNYTGNVGRVETVARVSFDGAQIGSQPSVEEQAIPYLLDFGRVKEVVTEAYVFIDQQCGLRVDGESVHSANWEWFLAGPAPGWGGATRTSQAFPPVDQPECQEEPTPDPGHSPGSESGGVEGSGWVTCWYLVTYDPYTWEIYEAQFLFCDGFEGG
jgi:hypothetical protein